LGRKEKAWKKDSFISVNEAYADFEVCKAARISYRVLSVLEVFKASDKVYSVMPDLNSNHVVELCKAEDSIMQSPHPVWTESTA
jgi:hypothetical protein